MLERLAARELKGCVSSPAGVRPGARVACRTAAETGAIGVLCLAFPLSPPRRTGPPAPSRLPELDAVKVPVLVIQGRSDPFGMPPPGKGRKVVQLDGTHGLKSDLAGVGEAAGAWLGRLAARKA